MRWASLNITALRIRISDNLLERLSITGNASKIDLMKYRKDNPRSALSTNANNKVETQYGTLYLMHGLLVAIKSRSETLVPFVVDNISTTAKAFTIISLIAATSSWLKVVTWLIFSWHSFVQKIRVWNMPTRSSDSSSINERCAGGSCALSDTSRNKPSTFILFISKSSSMHLSWRYDKMQKCHEVKLERQILTTRLHSRPPKASSSACLGAMN